MNSNPNGSEPSRSPEPGRNRASRSGGSRKSKAKLIAIVATAVVVGLVALGGAAKFAYPRFKIARGRQNAVEALSAMRKGQLDEAGSKVKTALAMAPKEPSVLRAAAQYCTLRNDPSGVNYYQMVLSTPEGTLADRTNLIRLAHSTKRMEPALAVLREMLLANSNDALALQMLVENHLLSGHPEQAMKAAAYAFKLNPTNAWFQYTLGSLLIDDPRAGKYQLEGRKLLFSLAISQSPESRAAQDRIARSRDLTKAEMAVLQRQIEGRTNQGLSDALLIYDLRQRQTPEKASDIVTEALKRYLQEDPELGLSKVIGWAASGQQFAPILAHVPSKLAQSNASIAPLYAAVLAAAGRWNDLETFLTGAESSIGKVLTAGFRARLAMSKGNRSEAEAQFRSLGNAKDVPIIDAQILAAQAEQAGLPDVAVQIYQMLARDPASNFDASRESLRLLGSLQDMAQVRDVAGNLSRTFPGDDGVAAEYAWANLVAKDSLPEALATMNRLHEKNPANPAWSYGLAFAQLRMERNAEALDLIQNAGTDSKNLSPRLRVVQALVLAANGQREPAIRAAQSVDVSKLRPAEQALLTGLR